MAGKFCNFSELYVLVTLLCVNSFKGVTGHTGFVNVILPWGATTLRFLERINQPVACAVIELIGIGKNSSSPYSQSSIFKLAGEMFNGRDAWTNGVDYLSFITSSDESAPYGTWLLGNEPGQDSGFAYLKPIHEVLTPLELESEKVKWHWLQKSSWGPVDHVRAVCRDETPMGDHFYRVEYFDHDGGESFTSFYVPSFKKEEGMVSTSAMLWDSKRQQWEALKSSEPKRMAMTGAPTIITDPFGKRTVGYLIQQEHGSDALSWRLFFKRAFSTDEEENLSTWKDDEVIVKVNDTGPMGGYQLEPFDMSTADGVNLLSQWERAIIAAKEGDYIWLWSTKSMGGVTSEGVNMVIGTGGSIYFAKPTDVHKRTKNGRPAMVESTTELLLRCVANDGEKIIFHFFPSDRRDTMRMSMLTKEAKFVIATSENGRLISLIDHENSALEVVSATNLGSDMVTYLRKYLHNKDLQMPYMPSCFFYHAAVTLPPPLLYAAEIICVLIGAKPLTLIQYSSPSDHQWKFPLVTEFSRRLIVAIELLGRSASGLDYRYNRYDKDETLVIFRSNRTYVADALVPKDVSQALHPLPYPDSTNPEPDWKRQIYNAWWNGYVLGYPERFVNSYCESFHNGLGKEDRLEQMRLAKIDAVKYLQALGKPVPSIGKGLEDPVPQAVWDMLKRPF